MINLKDAIKEKNYDEIINYYKDERINEVDKFGRTILHNLIVNKCPVNIFKRMIDNGADPYIKDKSGQNLMMKAIKFKNIAIVKYLIDYGFELNSSIGIVDTPWFFARENPEIADLLLKTKDSIRLNLTEEEEEIIDEVLYDDNMCLKLDKLNTPELIHGFILRFNYDDDLKLVKTLLGNSICREITAIECYLLLDGRYLLEHERDEYSEQEYYLIDYIFLNYPNVKTYYKMAYL